MTRQRPLRAALYHRVSTLDQDPTLAREELRTAARARGYEIALAVEETGSGARNDRPGLRQVLAAARKGQVQAVLVWKLDRWGRSVLDVLHNVEELTRAGCTFMAITQGLDIRPEGDATSGLLLRVLAAVAEFERELIRERTRAGVSKAQAAGKHCGRPRTGPDPARVRELRSQGRSWTQVGAELGCTDSAARRAARLPVERGVAGRP